MGTTVSTLKRVRQSRKSNLRNRHYKSTMNTTIKKFLTLDKKEAENNFSNVIKMVDQICAKGIIHKNKANNKKSKLAQHLNNSK